MLLSVLCRRSSAVEEEQVVDDVRIFGLGGDLRVGAAVHEPFHGRLDLRAELRVRGAEGDAVLLGAELLVNDRKPRVFRNC